MADTEYAGFWIRFGAVMIDLVFMLIVVYIPLSFIYGEQFWLDEKIIHGFWDVIPFVATIWFWRRFLGTPGKMALKLKVVNARSGEKLSTLQAIGRYFAYIPAMLPLGLGLIWVGIDKKKQGWHDELAGTVVIRDTAKETVRF
ncbi:RDD family protein [Solemya pervernicosa gill symbiont]|uniref:RDD family protein n=2 Tax=Gammaproteobacteria incertae sedis TaxID=118884 RepID=A0A1T2L6C6_9GAMM|nr:RDD family protein [Candidatus Reidiella endopervernicosa]OOZ40659.1 RDD family protein [Solemya pervernicosa gill symbiont]QKQ27414.1 RDD family protein [Candidatus Reidiella endopervernicosa]